MGRLKDALIEIETLWTSGLNAPDIAKITGHPISWVQGVIDDYVLSYEEMNQYAYPNDYDDGGP